MRFVSLVISLLLCRAARAVVGVCDQPTHTPNLGNPPVNDLCMVPGDVVNAASDTCCTPPATTTPTTPAPTATTPVAASTCKDLNNPVTGVSDCPLRVSLCANSVYYSVMKTQCPKTCGFCTASSGPSTPGCADLVNPITRVSDCPASVHLCTNAAYTTFMKTQCPKTCGYCSGTGTGTPSTRCADRLNPTTGVSDCPDRKALCSNSAYLTLMKEQCPLTCGFCTSGGSSGGTPTSTCADLLNPSTGVSDCPARKSYCTNSAYLALMKVQCPVTCGLCNTASQPPSTSGCADLLNPSTGVSDCPARKALCTNSAYLSLMQVQCPLTCGFCSGTASSSTSTGCVDRLNPSTGVSDCAGAAHLCTHSAYASFMAVQCPLTCGKC